MAPLKITTWNVNGLRAVLNKTAFEWLGVEKPDILCLQEIKARPDQLSDEHTQQFDGYYKYWNPAERPGYSGVATLARVEPDSVQLGLGAEQFVPIQGQPAP